MFSIVSFGEKFSHATLIAEGRVVSQYAFWNEAHTMTYTANAVVLSKVFSGLAKDSTIEVLTLGGVVGGSGVHASDVRVGARLALVRDRGHGGISGPWEGGPKRKTAAAAIPRCLSLWSERSQSLVMDRGA